VQNGIAQRLVEVEAYSGIVASTFRRLFPKDFDRAVPVVCHREVGVWVYGLRGGEAHEGDSRFT
jgi:hypothetical protein